ncbi:hypothetical protein M5E87_12945 [Flavonifractor plautii]|nr:hypothetical protein M5E87_12945 [Flavonifractor plautii]
MPSIPATRSWAAFCSTVIPARASPTGSGVGVGDGSGVWVGKMVGAGAVG